MHQSEPITIPVDYDREFKFSRITAATVPVFTDLIGVVEASDAHLVASVVNSREHLPLDRQQRRRKSAWQTHAEIITRLLKGCINKRELVCVLLDGIATPPGCSLSDTVRARTNRELGSTAVVSVASLDSSNM